MGSSFIVPPSDPALEAQLAPHLSGCRIGRRIHALRQIGSTMEVAHALSAEGAAEGTLIFALRQEQGRGRLGRTWASPEGGLYVSLLLRPSRPLAEIPQLSLVAGLSCAEAIHTLTRLFPVIRWPNDLLVQDRKMAGILVEARDFSGARYAPDDARPSVVIGIGINVTSDAAELPDTATSLIAHSKPETRNPKLSYQLTGELCRRFEAWYDNWSLSGFGPIREAIQPWMGLFGHPIQIATGSEQLQGVASGLDEQGRLVVRLDAGLLRAFEVGEVTLLR